MALYSFSGQVIGRGNRVRLEKDGTASSRASSKRSTSVAAAAYRAGTRLVDERTGAVYDYTRKGGVVHTEILLPPNAPGRYHDRQTLWNAVEQAEKQRNAQLSRELRIALPSELSREENIALVREFVQKQFVAIGMCADVAYHIKTVDGKDHNPHVHIMLTMRPMTKSGIWWKTKSRKEYIVDQNGQRVKNRKGEEMTRNIDLTGWNDRELYVDWRKAWAVACNERFEEKGLSCRLDHRSYKARGIELTPTVHLGKDATALERKGLMTEKGNYNRAVRAANEVADLGLSPVGLWQSVQAIFDRVKERQRLSKKARTINPLTAAKGVEATEAQAPRLEPNAAPAARSAESAVSGGSSPVRRDDQRRTDAPLHGAVRQGGPCTPEKDESAPLSSEKEPLRRLEAPTAPAVGGRSRAPLAARDEDALRRSNQVRGAIRQSVGTSNFLATRGIDSYTDLLAGARKASAAYEQAHVPQAKFKAEIDRLQTLESAVLWSVEYKAVAEQFERLTLFPGKFYQKHKTEIDRYRYAVRTLANEGYSLPVDAKAFAQRLAELEDLRDAKEPALLALEEELRLWCSAEKYVRDLQGHPEPKDLPNFSLSERTKQPERRGIPGKLDRATEQARRENIQRKADPKRTAQKDRSKE